MCYITEKYIQNQNLRTGNDRYLQLVKEEVMSVIPKLPYYDVDSVLFQLETTFYNKMCSSYLSACCVQLEWAAATLLRTQPVHSLWVYVHSVHIESIRSDCCIWEAIPWPAYWPQCNLSWWKELTWKKNVKVMKKWNIENNHRIFTHFPIKFISKFLNR